MRHGSPIPWRKSLQVTLPYLLVGALWIFFSDRILLRLSMDAEQLALLQSFKGLFFVVLTALLLQWLVSGLVRRVSGSEERLRRERATLDAVVRAVDDVIVTMDRRLRITNVWGRGLEEFDIEASELVGQTQVDVLGEAEARRHVRAARRALQGELVDLDWRLPARFGARTYQLRFAPLKDRAGRIDGVLSTMRDVTALRRAEEQQRVHNAAMERIYRVDPMTECANRRGLIEELSSLCEREDEGGVLALINIDHFRAINSTLGHEGGDAVLLRVARLLRERTAADGFVARLGGDEFAVLFRGVNEKEVYDRCETLRAYLAGGGVDDGSVKGQAPVSLSIGLAAWRAPVEPNQLLGRAQVALQEARDAGRGRTVRFSAAEHGDSPLERASVWLPRIEDALASGSFSLFLQPIVELGSSSTDAWEVLLRLPMPDGSMARPGEFLPAAERFGWMPRIDRWVITRAIDHLRARDTLRLFVNLSPLSLAEPGFVDFVEDLCRRARLRPGQLTIEFTETAAMGDMLAVREWVVRLRHLGCAFALDDFGTGFSTFNYLRSLGVDYVKLDGTFIRGLASDASQRTIVEAITRCAQALGKQVIAEMVEDEETRRILREVGVDYAQGWLWAQAEPAEQVLRRVSRGVPDPLVAH